MESIILACPNCAKRLKAPASTVGRTVKCPACGKPFTARAEEPAEAVAAKPAEAKTEEPPEARPVPPGMVECEACGRRVVGSAVEKVGGRLLCPRCSGEAKKDRPAQWKTVVGVLWDLVLTVVLIGCLIFWLRACLRPHPYNPFPMDMLIFPMALAICLPLFHFFLGAVSWWKRLVLAAVLLIDLGGAVAYGLNNEFGVLLSERAVVYIAAIILCGVPVVFGKGIVGLAHDLLARKPAGEGA